MKRFLLAVPVLLSLLAGPALANIYSTIEDKGEDYGDIYSTRGNRDIYTTMDDRQGVYTTHDSGTIYSTEDKREGTYTSSETPTLPVTQDVQGAQLMDSGLPADSVYEGYMP